MNKGKSESSQYVVRALIKDFEARWKHGLDFQVRNTSYNRYAGVVKQRYNLAVRDRIIAESPFLGVTTRWKRLKRRIATPRLPSNFEP